MTLRRRQTFIVDGRAVTLDYEDSGGGRLTFWADGQRYVVDVIRMSDDEIVIKEGDRQVLFHVVSKSRGAVVLRSSELSFHIQAAAAKLYDKERSATTVLGARQILSPVPGKVAKLLVQDGMKVGPGQGLIVLESMKTELVLSSPGSGTVRDIKVSTGQSVAKNQLLLVVEPENSE